MNKQRCVWVTDDPIYIKYHDEEWGRPVRDDQKLFEFLILEGAQAGLSWLTVLKKRAEYQKVFDDFKIDVVANYDEKKIQRLLRNPGIIRNKLKIRSAVTNARVVQKIQTEFGSFSSYIWSFIENTPLKNSWKSSAEVPVTTEISDALSRDLKSRGAKFVGSTIMYAFMQAVGMVDDHTADCCCSPKNSLRPAQDGPRKIVK